MNSAVLLVLMYHRARAERHGNAPELLDAHFGHIAARYRNVLPGEALSARAGGKSVSVCLSFDDAYFDFYAVVFPLLKKHGLRALLAVPVGFITDRTSAGREQRLAISSADAFASPELGGFCTWGELDEMAQSGAVAVAAHGFRHVRLDRSADLAQEIAAPQTVLRETLGQPVDSLIFPFGRYSRAALAYSRARYRHVFRIGGACNVDWDSPVLYRVDADRMPDPWAILSPGRMLGYRARRWWNLLRRR